MVSCVLLNRVEPIGSFKYVPLERTRTGEFDATGADIVVNRPYVDGCDLWFDHHSSNTVPDTFKGRYDGEAPSAARVIYDYYAERGQADQFEGLEELLSETDRVDDAQFEPEDILDPQGTVLISFLISAHPLEDEAVAENNLIVRLLDSGNPEDVLQHPVFQPKVRRFRDHLDRSKPALREAITQEDGVMVLDYRSLDPTQHELCDNKFLPFVMYPEAHTLLRIKHLNDERAKITLGFNMFLSDDRCPLHYGNLLAEYDGGGHRRAAGCSVPSQNADGIVEEIVGRLTQAAGEPLSEDPAS